MSNDRISLAFKPKSKPPKIKKGQARIEAERLRSYIALILFLLIATILAARPLYVASDDANYVAHFQGEFYAAQGEWWLHIVEEPLWKIYAGVIGRVFGPEAALRLTIFLSALLFLIFGSYVGKKQWAYILLIFLISIQLATQLYFNQIRQGLALSVFLIGARYGNRWGLLGAAVATLIHASFIFVLATMIIVFLTERLKHWFIYTGIGAAVFVAMLFLSGLQLNELSSIAGRRGDVYLFERSLNMRFYILWVPLYTVVIATMYGYLKSREDLQLWRFTFLYTGIVVIVSLFYEAAGRLIYLVHFFIPLLITASIRKRAPAVLAVGWVMFTLLIHLHNYFESDVLSDSWIGRWLLILGFEK